MNVLLIAVAFCTLVSSGLGASTYTTRFDNVDLDEILKNDRLYQKYYDCLIGEGKCTPDGKELKEKLPEALENHCEQCSEAHKKGALKVMKYIKTNRPEHFAQLEKLYDPQGLYRKRFEADAKKHGL